METELQGKKIFKWGFVKWRVQFISRLIPGALAWSWMITGRKTEDIEINVPAFSQWESDI
jgi:hypothetical protein